MRLTQAKRTSLCGWGLCCGRMVFRVAVLRSSVQTDKREDWYDRQLNAGVEVVICHPKLVETGLDYVEFELDVRDCEDVFFS
jgi:hypothetical protein